MSALVPLQFMENRLPRSDETKGSSDTRKMRFGGVVRAIYSSHSTTPLTIRVNDRVVVDKVSMTGLDAAPLMHWFRVEAGDEVTVEGPSGMGWVVTLLVDVSALSLLKLIGLQADSYGHAKTSVEFEDDVLVARMSVPDDACAVRFKVELSGPGAGFKIDGAHGHGLNAVDPAVGFGEVRKGGMLLIDAWWPMGRPGVPVSIAIYGRSIRG